MERVPTSLQFAVEGLQIFLSVVELSELVVCFSLKFFDVLYHRVQYMLSASRQEQNVFGEICFSGGVGLYFSDSERYSADRSFLSAMK